jgi:hypothetical protein
MISALAAAITGCASAPVDSKMDRRRSVAKSCKPSSASTTRR